VTEKKKDLKWARLKCKIKAFFRLDNIEKYTYHVISNGVFMGGFSSYKFAEEFVQEKFNRKVRRKQNVEIYTIKIVK
jgi:hypothetical protein